MLSFRLILPFLILVQTLQGQNCSISGFVEDTETGERLIGVFVTDTVNRSYTQTNDFGYFNLKITSGRNVVIKATYMGMKSKEIPFVVNRDTTFNIVLNPVLELSEVVISSTSYTHNVNSQLGIVVIPVKQLALTPSLGETDLLKAIQIQPGIIGGIEGSAGIFVRGGGAGENLFMLDDVPMYNVSHLYGFFSAFNSSAVKDIKLIKGCFPAKYGGRVSSVIDVRSLDGDSKTIKGEVSIGVISSKINIEGPITKDKTTFNISARRSYFDMYSGALKDMDLLDKDFPGYYFYDLNVRLSHTISDRDRVFIGLYKGRDKISKNNDNTTSDTEYDDPMDYRKEISGWGNMIASLRWNHTFNNTLFANSTIAFSKYNYYTSSKYNSKQTDSQLVVTILKEYSATYSSDINDIIIKSDLEYSVSNAQMLKFGAGNTFHTINPGSNEYHMIDKYLDITTDTSFSNNTLHSSEAFLYFEDEIKPSDKLLVVTGIRLSSLIYKNETSINAEPRLAVNYEIKPELVLKCGYSRMVQYMHLLTSSGLSMPTDIWIPAMKGVRPLKSDQVNLGLSYYWKKKALISVEVYKKWLYSPVDYRNGASLFIDFSPWYEKLTQGKGDAKGIEISIEKPNGKLTGGINYTLSTASRQFDDLNYGKTFPFDYDRRHDFNITVNYKLSAKWNFSALWVFGTGYPITIPIEKYVPPISIYTFVENPWLIYYYPSMNNYRLPAYHRLDLGLHYNKEVKRGEHSISFDVFNAYNCKNPVGMYYWLDYSFKYSYLLPIIPSITYTFKFY